MGMRRKGQWNIPLLVGAFILMGALPLVQTGIAGAADLVLQQKVFSNRASLHASALSGHMERDYIPEALNWSIYQASYELASEGGGADWSGGPPAEAVVRRNLERRVGNVFHSRYLDGSFTGLCRFDGGSSSLSVERGGAGDGFRVSNDVSRPPSVDCWAQGNNVTVYLSSPGEVSSTSNRYFLLYDEMTETVPGVQEELQGLEGNTYSGSGSACGSPFAANREARDEAENDAYSAIESEFDRALSGLPDSLRYSTGSVNPSASVTLTEDAEESGECDCEMECPGEKEEVCVEEDDDGNCIETEMQCKEELVEVCESTMYRGAEAEAEPAGATADIGIEDTANQVPTEDGKVHLEFLVEDLSFSIG